MGRNNAQIQGLSFRPCTKRTGSQDVWANSSDFLIFLPPNIWTWGSGCLQVNLTPEVWTYFSLVRLVKLFFSYSPPPDTSPTTTDQSRFRVDFGSFFGLFRVFFESFPSRLPIATRKRFEIDRKTTRNRLEKRTLVGGGGGWVRGWALAEKQFPPAVESSIAVEDGWESQPLSRFVSCLFQEVFRPYSATIARLSPLSGLERGGWGLPPLFGCEIGRDRGLPIALPIAEGVL